MGTMKQVIETKNIDNINCPFCEDVIGSDIANTINEVNGQWQCNNGHTFLVQYLHTMKE